MEINYKAAEVREKIDALAWAEMFIKTLEGSKPYSNTEGAWDRIVIPMKTFKRTDKTSMGWSWNDKTLPDTNGPVLTPEMAKRLFMGLKTALLADLAKNGIVATEQPVGKETEAANHLSTPFPIDYYTK